MDNKKQIGFEDLDNAKQKIQAAAMAFKKMLTDIGADAKFLKDCDIIYSYIHKIPHGADLLKMSKPPVQMPQESIQVNARSQDSTLDKAVNMAKANETDVVLNESLNSGNYRWGANLTGYIFTNTPNPQEVSKKLAILNSENDGIHFTISGELGVPKQVGQSQPDPDAHKNMDSGAYVQGESYQVVKSMSAKSLKESLGLKPKILTETLTVGELKNRMKNKS